MTLQIVSIIASRGKRVLKISAKPSILKKETPNKLKEKLPKNTKPEILYT